VRARKAKRREQGQKSKTGRKRGRHRERHQEAARQKLLDGDSLGMDRRSGASSRVMYTLTAINM